MRSVAEAKSETAFFGALCRGFVETGGYKLAWACLRSDPKTPVRVVGSWGLTEQELTALHSLSEDSAADPAATALAQKCPVIVADFPNAAQPLAWREFATTHGIHTIVALPFYGGDNGDGAIVLAASGSLSPDEVAFHAELVEIMRIATAAQHDRRLGVLLLSTFPAAIFETDRSGNCIHVNERWSELTGFSKTEAQGAGWLAAVHPDDRAQMHTASLQNGQQPLATEHFRIRTQAGTVRQVCSEAVIELDEHGDSNGILWTIADVTERQEEKEALELAELIVEQSPVILYRAQAGPTFPITYVSKNVTRFGYSVADILSGRVRYPDYIYEKDRATVVDTLRRAAQDRGNPVELDYRINAADRSIHWVHDRTAPVHDKTGQLVGFQGTLSDITESKNQEAHIAGLLAHDPLTGLRNRTSFSQDVADANAELSRSGTGFAVHLLGIDHFKDVNDTLGHLAGDDVLRVIARRLREATRANDVLARIGGDEFAVLQKRLNEPSTSGMMATRLLREIAKPLLINGRELRVTASIGIVVCEHRAQDPGTILSDADTALNRAKDQGRNTFRVHTDEIDSAVRQRVTLGEELRHALEHDELLLYYQPQFDIRDGSICGIEALVRWRHPVRGVLLPGTFIRIAEITGLIIPLGVWVLREGVRQMTTWMNEGLMPRGVAISVNLSVVQFRGGTIEGDVLKALEDFKLPPDRLELEVTELVFMEILGQGENVLVRLQKQGVRIAIDDFGTGYSSLAYVKRLRGMRLKIAQEFVRDIPADDTTSAVVRAVITMAKEIGLKFVAEGVETQDQLDFLRNLGCNEIQGFIFSRPLPAAAMTDLLRHGIEAERTTTAVV